MPTSIGPHLLGRIHKPDDAIHAPSSLMALHPAILTLLPSALPHSKVWTAGAVLDQGDTPQCTEFAAHDHVDCQPHSHANLFPQPNGTFYAEEKAIDGLPPGTDGSTTQASALMLQRHGLVNPPQWVFEEWTIRKWVLTMGPVQVGTNWWNSMFTPDGKNIVHVNAHDPNNSIVGGHEYLLVGYDYYGFGKGARQLYKVQNSWGTGWGDGGFFYLSSVDLATLFVEGADGFAAQNWDGVTPLPATP